MGTLERQKTNTPDIRLVTSDKTWIEGAALQQLEKTSTLAGIELAVGFPDLHPGKGFPVGAAFVSRDIFYPALAGNDIGCGMAFWQTDQLARKVKLDRLSRKLSHLDLPLSGAGGQGERKRWLEDCGVTAGDFDTGLGTIGGGNHFAELQQVHKVCNAEKFAKLGLDKKRCGLLVHSGSRALGQVVWSDLMTRHGYNGLEANSAGAETYLAAHNHAVAWASANRSLIAKRFCDQAGFDIERISDNCHNSVKVENVHGSDRFIHRKGAATARDGALMIPGSRGTLSYLVMPVGEQDDTAWSLAHGAGRRWQRGEVKPRLSHKYSVSDLERTDFGGRVICEDRDLLYEEAPQSYKEIGQVITDLSDAGLIEVIAVYKPMITFKCRRYENDER